ncbi:MAG TPA: NUDIX domain-containing protein [Patescibacteria group bacterium]|nr:NUDIX domain-containing protein [Patescibacteria group bacterium]
MIINKVALVFCKDKKILMGKNEFKDAFYFIGGSVEEEESGIQALIREVKEELDVELDESSIEFLEKFEAEAHGKKDTIVKINLYKGNILGEPKPTSEVIELGYFDSTGDQKLLTPVALKIFPWLKERGYIN